MSTLKEMLDVYKYCDHDCVICPNCDYPSYRCKLDMIKVKEDKVNHVNHIEDEKDFNFNEIIQQLTDEINKNRDLMLLVHIIKVYENTYSSYEDYKQKTLEEFKKHFGSDEKLYTMDILPEEYYTYILDLRKKYE